MARDLTEVVQGWPARLGRAHATVRVRWAVMFARYCVDMFYFDLAANI